jgi:hypothetical protein
MMRLPAPPLLLAILTLSTLESPVSAQLRAAAGKVDISPTRAAYIAGYASNRSSTGQHDPLWARCLVLQNGDQMVALVSCDLLGIIRPYAQKIRAMVSRVPSERVLIGATHTHSGPDTYGQWGPNPTTSGVDKEWMADTLKKIAALVDETASRLEPAKLRFGRVADVKDCSYNARVREILDTELLAMQVSSTEEKPIATLVNFACHPEVLNNRTMTSDFPHWLRQRLEAKLGGVAIYMNGALGGMVTAVIQNEEKYPKGEAWPEAERIGHTLADAALASLEGAAWETNPKLTFQQRLFRVPLENAGFKLLIAAKILPNELIDGSDIVTEVSRFTLGAAEFITLPGEVLPNIGLYLKSKMRSPYKFQLGLTGDALGYILTAEDFVLKLYEYESSVSVGPKMGPLMTENLLALIESGQ